MNIRQVGAVLFHADGWTDEHEESNSRFPKFCESAKKNQSINAVQRNTRCVF